MCKAKFDDYAKDCNKLFHVIHVRHFAYDNCEILKDYLMDVSRDKVNEVRNLYGLKPVRDEYVESM